MSSTSSSPELSDKDRYPTFMRTISNDTHQTTAVAKMMNHYGWNWVGVVYGDDDYGKSAFQSFLKNAQANQVCIAFQEMLPNYLVANDPNSEDYIRRVSETVRSSNAQVVLLILKAQLVELVFNEMIRTNTTRTWIASDAWSRSLYLATMKGINVVGDILGFTFIASHSESFDNYLRNLTITPGGYNHFIEEYKNLRFNCTPECSSDTPPSYCPSSSIQKSDNACNLTDPQAENDDYLIKVMDTNETFVHRVGVWATAHALKQLLKCNSTSCSGEVDFPPWQVRTDSNHCRNYCVMSWFNIPIETFWGKYCCYSNLSAKVCFKLTFCPFSLQLLEKLKNVHFSLDNQNFFFDNKGDFENGYDLVIWEKYGQHRQFQKIGRYQALDGEIQFDIVNVTWMSTSNSTVR